MKLTKEEVAARQLQSAIWMYAYDFDEVAVHTIAAAAAELYTQSLGMGNYKKETEKRLKLEKRKDFWDAVNKPNNFFKHGGKKGEALNYNPQQVDLLLFTAVEANLAGAGKYTLDSARSYLIYFFVKYPDILADDTLTKQVKDAVEKAKKGGIDATGKGVLRILLDSLLSPLPTSK
jgi:hypothetical protein